MPYVDKHAREDIALGSVPLTTGELTYVLTKRCDEYLAAIAGRRDKAGALNFGDLAEVLAALEATKLEFYRRIVAPYEDQKIAQNGDVYTAHARR